MKHKLYLTLLILLAFPLSAFEITLDNGDAFTCDLITCEGVGCKIASGGSKIDLAKALGLRPSKRADDEACSR